MFIIPQGGIPGSNPGPATNFTLPNFRQGFFMGAETLYQVYVLQNLDGKFYIGLSEDVVHRVAQHNSGVSKWTRSRGPWSLVWTSGMMKLTEARKLENQLKAHKGGNGFYRAAGLPPR